MGKYCLLSLTSNNLIAKTMNATTSGLFFRPGVVALIGLLIALMSMSISPTAYAHGGRAAEKDECSFRAEGHIMHFTAYQPTESNREELCKDIAATANTIFVLDIIDEVLRTVPVKIDIEMKTNETFDSFISIPAKMYETGSANFDLSDLVPGIYRISASLQAAESHMHTEEHKHRAGFLEFSIKSKEELNEASVFEEYSWVFYLFTLMVILLVISNKFLSRSK